MSPRRRDDRVALDRLALEGVALGGPVLERAGFEVEIEGLAVAAEGELSCRLIGRPGSPACRPKNRRPQIKIHERAGGAYDLQGQSGTSDESPTHPGDARSIVLVRYAEVNETLVASRFMVGEADGPFGSAVFFSRVKLAHSPALRCRP